ncbi:MAG: RNA methyltransferase [Deltaproteobacteria bacterium]|nr:RNA methyltransferase [Deltaproteobacteria bacterium]
MQGRGEIILKEDVATGSAFKVTGENHKNLLLWKPRMGEAFTVSGPSGKLLRARVTELNGDYAALYAFEDTGFKKDIFSVSLLQALPEKERMELIIQKTTELGVSRVLPFESKRSISLAEREAKQKKSHRWEDIALKAAKQSRRDTLPEILPYCSFREALDRAGAGGLKIMFFEGGGLMGLKEFLKGKKTDNAVILVGPEGGFTENEVREAEKRGFSPVTLGKRILRTETAGIIGVGIVMYELGGMG